MSEFDPLLPPSLLPETLWDHSRKTLRIPPTLAHVYSRLIQRHQLTELASTRDRRIAPVGGLTKERTDQHFAQAFDGSAARAELVLLDPDGTLAPVAEAAFCQLLGNRVTLTDAPCGAGASSLSLLCTVAELRRQKVLPRLPLDVALLGGELSPYAREYARNVIDGVRVDLEEQAIFLAEEIFEWDVTDQLSTTDLIQKITRASEARQNRLLVVANFNSALEKERKRKDAEPQLEELFRHCSGDQSEVLWIEPTMNRAVREGGLFDWLRKKIVSRSRYARDRSGGKGAPPSSSGRFYLPLEPGRRARVNASLLPISLVRGR